MGHGRRVGCRVAVACVGNPLRGDDAAGLLVAERLRSMGLGGCVVECPYGVELCAHRLRALRPRVLVVVDAALGVEPGEVIVAEPGELVLRGHAASTHALPPPSLLAYLESIAPRIVLVLLGVRSTGLGEEPGPEARRAAEKAAEVIAEMLGNEA